MAELQSLRKDLLAAAVYTTKYHAMFKHPESAGGTIQDSKYLHIQETMHKIRSRGKDTEKYTAFEQTPLLVADIYRYLYDVIDFMQCCINIRDSNKADSLSIYQDWHSDEEELIRMKEEVHGMLLAISPPAPDVVLHERLTHALHRAMYS
jgi:hypothetical protein